MFVDLALSIILGISNQVGSLALVLDTPKDVVVYLRAENNDFLLPNDRDSMFYKAVSTLSPQVAISIKTPAIDELISMWCPPGMQRFYAGDVDLPIIDTYIDLFMFVGSKGAVLVRDESRLVLWLDSADDVVPVFQDLEHKLLHMLKRCECQSFTGPTVNLYDPPSHIPVLSTNLLDAHLNGPSALLDGLMNLSNIHALDGRDLPMIMTAAPDELAGTPQCVNQSMFKEQTCVDSSKLAPHPMMETAVTTHDGSPVWSSSSSSSPSSSLLGFSPYAASSYVRSDLSPDLYFSSPALHGSSPVSSAAWMDNNSPLSTAAWHLQTDAHKETSEPLTISPALLSAPPISPAPETADDDSDSNSDRSSESDDDEMAEEHTIVMDEPGPSPSSAVAPSITISPILHTQPLPQIEPELDMMPLTRPQPLPQVEPETDVTLPTRKRGHPCKSADPAHSTLTTSHRTEAASSPLPIRPLPRARGTTSSTSTYGICPLPGRPSSTLTSTSPITFSKVAGYTSHPTLGNVIADNDKANADDNDANENHFVMGRNEPCVDEDDSDNDEDDYRPPPTKRRKFVSAPEPSTSQVKLNPRTTTTRARSVNSGVQRRRKGRKVVCDVCKQNFSRGTDLTRHKKTSNCSGISKSASPWKCPHGCTTKSGTITVFRRKDALQRHILFKHLLQDVAELKAAANLAPGASLKVGASQKSMESLKLVAKAQVDQTEVEWKAKIEEEDEDCESDNFDDDFD